MSDNTNEKSGAVSVQESPALSLDQIAALMNEEIQDPILKEFLFGMRTLKKSGIRGIGTLYKLLMFTFIFAHAKYRHDMSKDFQYSLSPNAHRAVDAFKYLYNGEDISLDLVIYVLTEMQLDVVTSNKNAYFDGIISNSDASIQIPIFRSVIKTWLSSAAYAESNEKVLAGYLYGLYSALPYLKNIELRAKDQEIIDGGIESCSYDFYYKSTKETIPNFYFLKNLDGEFYFLESIEEHKDGVTLKYSLTDGKKQFVCDCEKKDFFSGSRLDYKNNELNVVFAKSLYSLDFKYIKNLALAVSDVITDETKRKINAHYSVKYSDIFELGYKAMDEINWDNVLTILMFEEGPSNVLEFVLDSDGIYFDKILQNLAIRYNNKAFLKEAKRFYKNERDRETAAMNDHAEANVSFVKSIIEMNKILMAKAIINQLSTIEKKQKTPNSCFVESLPMRIKNINETINSDDSVGGKVLSINRTLEKTFRYIIPFYYGIIAYTKKKNELHGKFQSLPDDAAGFTSDMYHQCDEAFKCAAAAKAKELVKASLGKLIADFRALGDSLITKNKKDGHKLEIQENGMYLKEAIGRSYLYVSKPMEDILKIDTKDMTADYIKKDYNIISYINDVKHSKKGGAVANVILFKQFLIKVKELLYFLTYNEDYFQEVLLGQQVSYDPVYPYVVQYEEKSERRDCCDINSFSVYLTEDNGKREIKILSERDYVINEKYYCIPNMTTSNSHWWIDPFLFNCREYDQIIMNAMAGKERLAQSDDD